MDTATATSHLSNATGGAPADLDPLAPLRRILGGVSSLPSIAQAFVDIANPFDSTNPDADRIGVMALCAGAAVAIDIFLLAVVVASRHRRRPTFVPAPLVVPATGLRPAMPRSLEPGRRENPLIAMRAKREAELRAADQRPATRQRQQ